jgi:hypothetical protein
MEQRTDLRADVTVAAPRWSEGRGPRLVIDGGHGNYHTAGGRFAPFAALLRNDGMRVEGTTAPFTDEALAAVDILVIANATHPEDRSAFTAAEIAAVTRFVSNGGSVLLIVDHIPYPAAAADLGSELGFDLRNVFAEDDGSGQFTRTNGGLTDDPLLEGISRVRTFAGSAFSVTTAGARPLLRLGDRWTIQTMEGSGLSTKAPAAGLLQGALAVMGDGRIAVFGEAGMFTAQIQGPWNSRMGFNAKDAKQNRDLILRVVHWLADARTPAVKKEHP